MIRRGSITEPSATLIRSIISRDNTRDAIRPGVQSVCLRGLVRETHYNEPSMASPICVYVSPGKYPALGYIAAHIRSGSHARNNQSQSLSRSYGSNLPNSLTYFDLLTRGYSPWRPDAVMGTILVQDSCRSLAFSWAYSSRTGPEEPIRAILFT